MKELRVSHGYELLGNYHINRKERSQVAHKNLHLLGDSQHFFQNIFHQLQFITVF